jgi:hypothetical protein
MTLASDRFQVDWTAALSDWLRPIPVGHRLAP